MPPQMLPVMMNHVPYVLESDRRCASIARAAGAGGIGLALADRIRINNFDEVAFIVLMILVTVAVIDTASGAIHGGLIAA
jgi:phosphonate transport system permease protein